MFEQAFKNIDDTLWKDAGASMSASGMYGNLQGIVGASLTDGKGRPILRQTSTGFVELTIPAQVKDKNFVYFLEKIAKEKQIQFDFVKDLIFLDQIREKQFSDDKEKRDKFLKLGIIEKVGRGRGMKYILSNKFYAFLSQRAEYTRTKWLEKEQQKEVLWKFFQQHKKGRMRDFREGLFKNRLNNRQIVRLLKELEAEDKIYFDGKQRSPVAYWRIKQH